MRGDQIMARVFNNALMCEPGYLQTFVAALSNELPGQNIESILANGQRLTDMQAKTDAYNPRGGKVFDQMDGIAILEVSGTVAHRTGNIRPRSGMTGIDGLSVQLDAAVNDPEINGILLHVNSPGGEVSGTFDLADEIFAARKQKPIWALVDELAASAAFALASSASRIVAPRTARAGSIGVVIAHVNRSKELEQKGREVSFIHAGRHKVDGDPTRPLPNDVRARLQADVDRVHDLFVSTVARNRGLSDKSIRGTEAALFGSAEALKLGLIDEIAPAADTLLAFSESIRNGTARNSRRAMTTRKPMRSASRTLVALTADIYDQPEPRDPAPRKPLNAVSFYK